MSPSDGVPTFAHATPAMLPVSRRMGPVGLGGSLPASMAPEMVDYWKDRLSWGSLVYVVRVAGESAVKIGVAVDVPARIATLQTGNPRKLELLHVFPNTARLELALHSSLADERLIGEWFDGSRTERFVSDVAPLLTAWFVEGFERTGRVIHFHDFKGWDWVRPPAQSASERRRQRQAAALPPRT